MGNLKKNIIVLISVLAMQTVALAAEYFSLEGKNLQLRTPEGIRTFTLEEPLQRNRAGGCVRRGFTLDDTLLHAEYLQLRTSCAWNGLASSIYHGFLRQKVGGLNVLERFEAGDYKIVLYEKGKKRFYYLSTYDASSVLFLLDYSGELARSICARCGLIAKQRRFEKTFDESLAQHNFVGHYFSKEGGTERFFPPR